MRTKSFRKYLETRLDKDEIREIERQAHLEVKMLRSIQNLIADTMAEYMEKEEIGFNELVRRLHSSPTQVAKMQRGEANLTLSTMAHLFALLGKEPQDVFVNKKRNK